MMLILTIMSRLVRLGTGRLTGHSTLFCQAPLLWIFAAATASAAPVNPLLWIVAASAAPVILNQPFTAKPGDVISVEGSGFGLSPTVMFKPAHQAAVPVKIVHADSNIVSFEVPKTQPFDAYYITISNGSANSKAVYVNMPRAMHFDTPEIASGDSFRVYGYNINIPPAVTSAVLTDVATGTTLSAIIHQNLTSSYSAWIVVPPGIVPGHSYRVMVSNGFGTIASDKCILGRAAAGNDHFQLGVPWGRDFVYQDGPAYNGTADNADHHVYNVRTDPFLALHATGNGVTDDQPAIQAAIDHTSLHGGIVYFPPGTYRLASPAGYGIFMRPQVVLQGHAASDTTILFGPASAQNSSYTFFAFYWQPGSNLSGIADLSLKNIDTASQNVLNAGASSPSSKVFIQRVNWDLGTGKFINLYYLDRLVIENSTFHQAINNQFPDATHPQKSGGGPFWLSNLTNFTFRNNQVSWASGANAFLSMTGEMIEGNHFTRSASDKITVTASNISWLNTNTGSRFPVHIGDRVQRSFGRQIAVDMSKDFVIQNNIFDVSDGDLAFNFDDGETINSEGGSSNAWQDVGTVTSASAMSVTDGSKHAWHAGPFTKIAIVSGQGWGQWRNIVSKSASTFTIEKAWDIIPAAGDNFAVFYPSAENALIRNNTAIGNPAGILLFHAAYYNVSIVNNTLTDNGGIMLFGMQNVQGNDPYAGTTTGTLRNVEVNGNNLTDTRSRWATNITAIDGLVSPNYLWGTAMDGVEVRNNSISTLTRTPLASKLGWAEGYLVENFYQDPYAPFSPAGTAPGIAGTIIQGNSCLNCPVAFTLSTGDLDTVIWNATVNGVKQTVYAGPPFILDKKIWNTATQASVGTTVGAD